MSVYNKFCQNETKRDSLQKVWMLERIIFTGEAKNKMERT